MREHDAVSDYSRVCAVLNGSIEQSKDAGSVSKMVSLLLHGWGVDAEFNRKHFLVRYPHRRRSQEYFTDLAAPTLKILMENSGLAKVTGQARARIQSVGPLTNEYASILRDKGPWWLWIVRRAEMVSLTLRAATGPGSPPEHPLPLPPWTPSPKIFVRLSRSRNCLHCSSTSETFRKLGEVLVCPRCGISFEPSATEMEDAKIERTG
jgi:hypothetical protein